MNYEPRIQRAPADLSSVVRSNSQISNLSAIVDALVCNSLESGATEVAVHIDTSSFAVTVRDDGWGIPQSSLKHIGSRHFTSKHVETSADGRTSNLPFRGESLAAICENAVVEVCSRAEGNFQTHCIVLRGGQVLKSGLAQQQRLNRGTIVSVRDIFYNRPVQRKSLLASGIQREIDRCKHVVEHLGLMRPATSFLLYDASKKKFILKLLKGRNQEESISSFFGHPPPHAIVPIVDPQHQLACCVAGWAVLPPHGASSPAQQWIYINKQFARAPAVSRAVQQLYTEVYAKAVKWDTTGGGADLQVLRKGRNRHAMFVLHIQCSSQAVDLVPEPDAPLAIFRDSEEVEGVVREAVMSAWRPALSNMMLKALEEGAARFGGRQMISSPAGGTRHSAPGRLGASLGSRGDDEDSIDQDRVGDAALEGLIAGCEAVTAAQRQKQRASHPTKRAKRSDPRAMLESLPVRPPIDRRSSEDVGTEASGYGYLDSGSLRPNHAPAPAAQPRDKRTSMDWHSRQQWLAQQNIQPPSNNNSNVVRPRVDDEWPRTKPSSTSGTHSKPLALAHAPSVSGLEQEQQEEDIPPRAPSHLTVMNNTNYTNQGPAAAVPPTRLGALLSSWRNPTLMPSSINVGVLDLTALAGSTFIKLQPPTLQRTHLLHGRALHQVDNKFIPIVCGRIIAIVDQHAADERVRLEDLKGQVMTSSGAPLAVHSLQLQAPQPLGGGDGASCELLGAYGSLAQSWGWRWARYGPGGALVVTHVPVICGTALTATDLLLYLHRLEETRGGAGPPAGVLRALNSKACRSAIMFGDDLVPAECQDLLENLKETQLCFICAHGRPTTAPIVDLGPLSRAVAVRQQAAQGRSSSSVPWGSRPQRMSSLKKKLLQDLNKVAFN